MTSGTPGVVTTTVANTPANNINTAALAEAVNGAEAQPYAGTPSNPGEKDLNTTTSDGEKVQNENRSQAEPPSPKKTFRFFSIIAALALSGLLTSLEATITSTALPTITADLGGANLYIWVVNGFYLTQ